MCKKKKQISTKHFIIKCHHGNCKTSLNKEVFYCYLYCWVDKSATINQHILLKFKGLDIVEMCWSPNEGWSLAAWQQRPPHLLISLTTTEKQFIITAAKSCWKKVSICVALKELTHLIRRKLNKIIGRRTVLHSGWNW